jgi:hypothetical protein
MKELTTFFFLIISFQENESSINRILIFTLERLVDPSLVTGKMFVLVDSEFNNWAVDLLRELSDVNSSNSGSSSEVNPPSFNTS